MRVSIFRWIFHYPKKPLMLFLSSALFIALTFFIHWAFIIIVLKCLHSTWHYWQQTKEHFKCGCVNLGIVVSTSPLRYAVYTDLSKGVGKYPVIKIIEKNFSMLGGQKPQKGTRFATIALYQNDMYGELPHWFDFEPHPCECATGDLDVIQRIMDSIEKEDWVNLMAYLQQVRKPFACGLHPIESVD